MSGPQRTRAARIRRPAAALVTRIASDATILQKMR
ncbi:hypothetical protein FHT10_001942 [Xanthomonas arboricola]|nr:hypothetical protein [Xanthomonas cannabis]